MHLLKQPCHFSLLRKVFDFFYRDSKKARTRVLCIKCKAVPGGLLSKFTASEKPYVYGPELVVMQMWKN